MSANIKKFHEEKRQYTGERYYLAVGYIEEIERDRGSDDATWRGVKADGTEDWFWSHSDAMDWLAADLVKPVPYYTLP